MTIAKAQLTERVQDALVKRARRADPLEVCGFIMNSADPDTEQFVFDVPNMAKDQRHSWQMDPAYQSVVMQDEENMVGVWHSHPRGPDGPSARDLRYMLPKVRFFVATLNGVFEYGMEQQ